MFSINGVMVAARVARLSSKDEVTKEYKRLHIKIIVNHHYDSLRMARSGKVYRLLCWTPGVITVHSPTHREHVHFKVLSSVERYGGPELIIRTW